MRLELKRFATVRMLAKGVFSQIVLSAGNFAVGLILLRYTSNDQYASYVLVFSGLLMLTSLQGAFVGPAMVTKLAQMGPESRADFIGGLYAGQRWLVVRLVAIACVCIVILRAVHVLNMTTMGLVLASLAAAWAALYRQFFRMVSNAYRNSAATLRGDVLYVALLLCGALLAIFTPAPAIVTLISMTVGAIAAGQENRRSLWRDEQWNMHATARVWRGIAAVGTWTAAGSVAHWAFTQGYNYVIAGAVNLAAVAALGSTRMLMTPITLLSMGVSALMLATVSGWLSSHGVRVALHRVTICAAGMAGLVLLYAALFWPLRDLIFVRLLHKSFPQRDLLLLVWWLASATMVARDQFMNFCLARARYRSLTILTVLSAVIALTTTAVTIDRLGAAAGAIGVLVGELFNITGLIAVSQLDARRTADPVPLAAR